MKSEISIPDSLRDVIGTAQWEQVTVGLSGDMVYRLTDATIRYLKIGRNIEGEADRLRWLSRYLPVPDVLHFAETETYQFLLMSEVPGEMVHEIDLPPLKRVQLMAQGLKRFHELSIADCPFDRSLKVQLEVARENVESGVLTNIDIPGHNMQIKAAFVDLQPHIPKGEEDLVVVHGDYCLPNILINPKTEQITGFIDLGRVGVSDRYTDIAVAARSIRYNLGDGWDEPFFEAYGIIPDPDKMLFYRLLDEFN